MYYLDKYYRLIDHFTASTPIKKRRGRPLGGLWAAKVFLLRQCSADYMPGCQEQAFLTANGFGEMIDCEKTKRTAIDITRWQFV